MAENDRKLFVGTDLRILTGSEAENALRSRSDAQWVDPENGVFRVTLERWHEAQEYERTTWLEANRDAVDDRNQSHFDQFQSYEVLRGRQFGHAIELGCGPFTNMRVVATVADIQSCSLLDPLATAYLAHPHCTYSGGRTLQVRETSFGAALGRAKPLRAIRRLVRGVAPRLMTTSLPIIQLISSPIEEMPENVKYDLVVMINVLEHCYDADMIFRKIESILKPRGVLIFHDKIFTAEEATEDALHRYDAGHPLRVASTLVENHLRASFTPLFETQAIVHDGVDNIDLSRRSLYFIGERCESGK